MPPDIERHKPKAKKEVRKMKDVYLQVLNVLSDSSLKDIKKVLEAFKNERKNKPDDIDKWMDDHEELLQVIISILEKRGKNK